MLVAFILIQLLLTQVWSYPAERVGVVKREVNGSYTTDIQSIPTEDPKYDVADISSDMADKLLKLFWSNNTEDWLDQCGSTNAPVVWQVAVAGKVMTNTENEDNMKKAITALSHYRNSTGGYSASTAKNGDIYTDDNAQIAWVFSDAYAMTHDDQYLKELQNITDYMRGYVDKARDGGILWSVTGKYISSISTTEAAVAALDLYQINKEDKYLDFAKDCLIWTLDNFVDPNDGYIYDGMYEDGSLNTGKLTYTIGTLISACAMLEEIGDDDKDWKAIAVEFGVKLISGGSLNNQFFSDGHINDIIDRSHLVYVGFADLLKKTIPTSSYQRDAYNAFEQLLVREARNLRESYSDVFTNDSCPEGDYSSLLKFASLAQVFDEVSRVVSRI